MIHPRHITLRMKWPERYFSGLTKSQKLKRESELMKRKKSKNYKLGPSNKMVKSKKSRWTAKFHQVYPELKFKKNLISKRTGIPVRTLNIVYDKGLKAWKTAGSRVGANPHQWAAARVMKFVLISKKKVPKSWYANRFDPNNYLRKST